MADRVFVEVSMDELRDLEVKMARIMKPKVTYYPNTETYLKNVIAEQTDRAIAVSNILNTLMEGGR
jgi:hypothetical protein